MKRMALNLKIHQHIILPSGRVARVKEIARDVIVFVYCDTSKRLELSRFFCVEWFRNE
ncbi:hypothetical protein [Kingella negevensis]|uniref:hypothetical protein n=1 Tax=Kingella negevensis TaxID=1522312 RepID=UPI000ADDA89C|nr:hypothetical protein [Kingella negevensis]MDK4688511.1 hypothetical protein [Kingella negevensis]WII91754.1 hypothetical protein QEO93_03995 [Kingella negevensis]